jgi:DNA-binding response OmpR family regulator
MQKRRPLVLVADDDPDILSLEEATRHLPVILLTARVQESDIARGVEAGADDYVKKPFSTHELRDRVQAVLGR